MNCLNLVRVADSPSAGSRVRFLLRLSAAKIAEMFMEAGNRKLANSADIIYVCTSPSSIIMMRNSLNFFATISSPYFFLGVEREPKKSELFSELEKYFCVLPLQGKELVYRLIVENINSKQQNNFHLGRLVISPL